MANKLKTVMIIILPLAAGLLAWRYFAPAKNAPAFAVDLPAVYGQTETVSFGNLAMALRPLEVLAAAAITDGASQKYSEAYAQTDVVKTVSDHKVKEDIILKAPGHPEEFRFALDLPSLFWKKDEQGNLVFYQADNNDWSAVFRMPAPFLTDARGQRSSGQEVETWLEDDVLIMRPSLAWLTAHPYPIVLDPTIELVILNVHSHPLEGDDWSVSFTTAGQADLRVIPNDAATIADDEFVSLWCGAQQRTPEIRSGDEIFFAAWECADIGRVVHRTLKAGDHILRFEFGGEIAYAYNGYSENRKYAWAENAGWLNASSTHAQAVIAPAGLAGYLWGENIGWIKLDYDGTPGATNTTATDWGVTNDGQGHLGGYGWGENIGWVNFHPSHAQVTINYDTGELSGSAWAENIGWINFGHAQTNYTLLYAPLTPAVTTTGASNVASRAVTLNGYAWDGATDITERGFKYGLSEADTWTIVQSGTFNTGNFTAVLEDLEPGQTYYYRAYAVNSEGTAYGAYAPFTLESEHKSFDKVFKEDIIFREQILFR